jgi:NADH:ubiquinone oxidoreductase subunit
MNQDANALRAYINEVSRNRRVFVYDRLTEACKVPRSTVANWRNGRTKIKEVYKDIIEEVAGKKIFTR